jgi:hypothetical protein
MWALFKTYSQVVDSNITYSFVGVFNTIELATEMKDKLKKETGAKYHDYYICLIEVNQLYDNF